MHDLRFALRQLRKSPGFSLVAIATLALGIGANTAIFSVVECTLLRPLPFPKGDRLVRLYELSGGNGAQSTKLNLAPANLRQWRENSTEIFQGIGAATGASLTLGARAGEPARNIPAALVSANFFDVVALRPILGRNFVPAEDVPGAARVAIVGYDFWQQDLGGRADALGKTVQLDGLSYTVIGVMPKTFRHPYRAQVWLPLRTDYSAERSQHHYLYGVARLSDGLTIAQAQAATDRMCAALKAETHNPAAPDRTELIPLRDSFILDLRPKLLIIAGAALCALLVAAANFAGLLLSRAVEHGGEMAMRAALGASRAQLVRQGLVQSLVLTAAGTLCGLLVAGWLTPLLVALSPEGADNTGSAIREFDYAVRLDWPVFAFAAGVMLMVGIGVGLFPAWRAARVDVRGAIGNIGRGATLDGGTRRWLSGLIIAEIAIAAVLLVGSLSLTEYFRAIVRQPWGFVTDHRLVFHAMFSDRIFPTPDTRLRAIDRTLDELRTLPGVRSATVTAPAPMDASWDTIALAPEGSHPPEPSGVFYAYLRATGPGYFATMGQRLVQGREFTANDRPGQPPVCIVNQAFAQRFWPNENPIGKRIREGRLDSAQSWLTVVGLTNDTKAVADPRDGEVVGTIYVPLKRAIANGFDEMTFVTETDGPALAIASDIRSALGRADRRIAAYNIGTLEDAAADSWVTERFLFVLVSLFGVLGLVLAAIGVYGLLALQVARRIREFGVRLALGATGTALVRLVAAQGARLLAFGFLIGTAGAWGGVRLLQHEWPGVPTGDPLIWLGAAAVLSLGVALASWLPARRAGRVDPMEALRYE
jgi:putative ABC transport system permease protein